MRLNKPDAGGLFRDRIGKVVTAAPPRLFSDFYYYLSTVRLPILIALVAGAFAAINAGFAICYLLAGGVANARAGSFIDAFFFSVQTMATIGYGIMAPRSFAANLLVSVEALTGLIGLALVTGVLFARISRPTARVRFSRVAIISPLEGVPSLMFRAVNERNNRIVEARVHVVLSRWETTREGQQIRRFHDLPLARDRNALFSLSWTVIHPIVPGGPLAGETAESLRASRAMLIVSLIGMDESFLQTAYARYVWTADEIVFGARFVDILEERADGTFSIDYSRFDEIVPGAGVSAHEGKL